MIKFWKSAAKGKTGCPVRPPEENDVQNLLSSQTVDETEDTLEIFEKKSILSLTLYNILEEKKGLKYFVHFMETTDKHLLIKCWLEIEHFKILLTKINSSCDIGDSTKVNRTKSFDLPCDFSIDKKEKKTQRYSWRESTDLFSNTATNLRSKKYSSGSCKNLSEYNNDVSEDTCNKIDITEKAINLFKKYVALEAPYQLDLPDNVRKMVISNICQPEGGIKDDCFKSLQDEIFNQIENNCYKAFSSSPYYIKAQIDILTNGTLSLKDILYDETIIFYFTEYMEQESCSVLLEFLMAVVNFRDNLTNGNASIADQVQADAIVLYDKYFSLQATNPVGFPTDIRLYVESEICREGGPQPTCFDLPYRIAYKTLSQYVKAFLESEMYYKYLSEMIRSVDQMLSSNHKTLSDCSSEFSISTQNTLLAMGDPIFRKKKRNLSVPDMTIDSNQLYNADALWQRSRNEGLSLGRVNSLGRFESKFEPDPDKKDKSVLKKMVSKFVPMSTSKVEEEMAWQIAHMIVKDVTDLTMAPPDNERED